MCLEWLEYSHICIKTIFFSILYTIDGNEKVESNN